MQNNLKNKYDQVFNESYAKLNDAQRTAVNKIEGPVMVIAGPGTGKTQILAVRIGKILKETDTDPHNILCLTFTDAATISMRKRLVSIIGPEAHKVHIYTFHGFTNQVIQENLDVFGNYKQLEPITDLEKVDVFDELIAGFSDDNPLKKFKGNSRYEAKRMENLFSMMKKENLGVDQMRQKISEFLERKKDSDEFLYKRKTADKRVKGAYFQKGDFKKYDWEIFENKYIDLKAGVDEFDKFNAIMDRLSRYDFQDMIIWVLKAFKENPDLLSSYQERYQYVLVDEYQDTNGAQNDILELLISYWEDKPNVFVVGDDDQAIYKFQGANLSNIQDFQKKYQPYMVVLENNYRSNQEILNAASGVIQKNTERIVNDKSLGLTKKLISAGDNKKIKNAPKISAYVNVVQEQADIADQLVKAHQAGEDLSKTAIIYRNHSQVEKLVEVLEKKNIPLNIKRKIDILKHPFVDNILNILYYLEAEYRKPNSEEFRLFELMHYPFFNIDARDIAKIALRSGDFNDDKLSYRDIMSNKEVMKSLGIKNIQEVFSLDSLLSKWTSDIASHTLQTLFEIIINEGFILQSVMNLHNRTWMLQILSTLFDQIKEETNKDPKMKLKEFLSIIDKMKETEIPLEINKIVHSDKGIHFLTAHSSKGLEFNKVYMLGCTKNIWDSSRRTYNSYSYPDNVNEDVASNTEDERRLFYVAMTRTETDLNISFAEQKENGKSLGASQFVDEIIEATNIELIEKTVDNDVINDFQFHTMLKKDKEIKLIDHDEIDKVLQRYKLSVTGLNKYLKCPMSFYFGTILRVPSARSMYAGFGRAIHQAFQYYFNDIVANKNPDLKDLLFHFKNGMDNHRSHFTATEFKDLNVYGTKILTGYYKEYLENSRQAKSYHTEYKIDQAEYNGVPIKGVIDKVDIYEDYVEVVDYKTGSHDKTHTKANLKEPNDKDPVGGDYWRQIVFYKILLDSDQKNQWNMHTGYMDFVEPHKKTSAYFAQKYVVSPEQIELVGSQIETAWNGIQNHEFNQLCEDENCYWCNFVRNDYVFDLDVKDPLEDEIQEM